MPSGLFPTSQVYVNYPSKSRIHQTLTQLAEQPALPEWT